MGMAQTETSPVRIRIKDLGIPFERYTMEDGGAGYRYKHSEMPWSDLSDMVRMFDLRYERNGDQSRLSDPSSGIEIKINPHGYLAVRPIVIFPAKQSVGDFNRIYEILGHLTQYNTRMRK